MPGSIMQADHTAADSTGSGGLKERHSVLLRSHADAGIRIISGAQYDLVTRRQLRDRGWTDVSIRWAVKTGRLFVECPGVYSIGRPIETDRAFWMAGVLAAGSGAALSRNSAARLWGFSNRGDRVDVLRAHSRKPRITRIGAGGEGPSRQLLVRRTRNLPPDHVTVLHGIPTTTAERALLDLAGDLSAPELEFRFLEADRLGLLDDHRLAAILTDGCHQPGIGRLRRLVEDRGPDVRKTRSVMEALLQRRLRQRGIPPPEPNAQIGPYRVDFLWRDAGLIVEADGLAFHSGRGTVYRDTRRENYLRRQGNEVIRFGWLDVTTDAEETLDLIEARYRTGLTERRSASGLRGN